MATTPRKNRGRKWSEPEQITLLGTGDAYVTLLQDRGSASKEGLVKYVHRRKLGQTRTVTQIEKKFSALCLATGRRSLKSTRVADFLARGISSLHLPDPYFRAQVKTVSDALVSEHRRPRPATGEPNTPVSVWGTSAPTPTRTGLASRSRSVRSPSTFQSCIDNAASPTPLVRQTAAIVPNLQRTSVPPSTSSLSNSLPELQSNVEQPADFDGPLSRNIDYTADSELQRGLPRLVEVPTSPIFEYDRPEAMDRFYEPGIHSHDKALLIELWRDNLYFRRENRRLEAESRGLDSARQLGSAANIQNFIDEKQRERDSKEQRRIRGLFGARDGKDPSPNFRTIKVIRELFEKMKLQCQLTAENEAYHYPKDLLAVMGSTGATALLDAAFGMEQSGQSSTAGIVSRIRDHVPAERLVFSLVGASIQEWVFKPTLRCINMLSTPLLEKYREHIRALRGETILQSIDFEAHHTLIAEQSFQKSFLQPLAESYTSRILPMIRPFLVQKMRRRDEHTRNRLQNMFENALRIKLQAICCKDLFSTSWPLPGTTVDLSVVSVAGRADNARPLGPGHAIEVLLPLIPGLQRHAWHSDVADYCSFDVQGKEGLGDPELVCEAFVVAAETF